jgi:hypothetical protein
MFGSSCDTERAYAAAMADKLVREHGLTWHQVLTPAPRPLAAPPAGITAKLALLHQHFDALSPWEREFVRGLRRFSRLSPKQQRILDALIVKVGEPRRAA